MKSRKSTPVHSARKTAGAMIAKRYLDLQKLRDEVRKAELSCGRSLNDSRATHLPQRRQP
jgi:hypothetical protein